MRLAGTYQRFYSGLLGALLLIGGGVYYLSLRYLLVHQVDNDLKVEQQELFDFVRLHDSLPAPSRYRDQQLEWAPAGQGVAADCDTTRTARAEKGRFGDGRAWNPREHEWEPVRRISFSVRVKGRWYGILISKSLEETDDLILLILVVTGGLGAVLIAGLFIGNRFLLRRLWQPFYQTLAFLRSFRLSSAAAESSDLPSVPAGPSNIEEFDLLSRSARDLTDKMRKDYVLLKQFTDHAAHEMQTPLALMKSKLDLLLQDPSLGKGGLIQVQHLLDSVNRLSRLHQSLLLLTRIENRQYLDKQPVALDQLLLEKLDWWQEWIQQSGLRLEQHLEPVTVQLHPFLAESLVDNLLGNAVRHTSPGGSLRVDLQPTALRVANSGAEPLDKARLFQRFAKQRPSQGVGLGLAIAREIAELSGCVLSYSYEDGFHVFTVSLRTA